MTADTLQDGDATGGQIDDLQPPWLHASTYSIRVLHPSSTDPSLVSQKQTGLLFLSIKRPPIMNQHSVPGEETMKPSEALSSNRAAIRQVVNAHRACNARVFGSVLRGQDTDSSDLDILIDPTPDTTLFDIGAIRHELGKLLGVPVDVLTPNALPDSFRATVLAEAEAI